MVDGPRAAFLPAPVMQAATWSKSDVKAIGQLLCKEARSKAAQILAAPTICCQRNPLGGRNFESFSEDPFRTLDSSCTLTIAGRLLISIFAVSGSLAIEYVAGIQETGEVVATAKHLCVTLLSCSRSSTDETIALRTNRSLSASVSMPS